MCLKLKPEVKATKKTELKKDVWIPAWGTMHFANGAFDFNAVSASPAA